MVHGQGESLELTTQHCRRADKEASSSATPRSIDTDVYQVSRLPLTVADAVRTAHNSCHHINFQPIIAEPPQDFLKSDGADELLVSSV